MLLESNNGAEIQWEAACYQCAFHKTCLDVFSVLPTRHSSRALCYKQSSSTFCLFLPSPLQNCLVMEAQATANYTKTDITGTCWPAQNYKRMPLSGSCTTLNFYSHVTKMPWDCMAFEPWHLHTKQPFCQPLEQTVLQTLLLHSCHRELGVFPSQIWSSSQKNHKRESGGVNTLRSNKKRY